MTVAAPRSPFMSSGPKITQRPGSGKRDRGLPRTTSLPQSEKETKEENNYSSKQILNSIKGPTSLQADPPKQKREQLPSAALPTILFPSQIKLLTHCRCSLELTSTETALSQRCENHARKMRTFFTRRLEPKTRSSYHIKWSNAK